MKRFLPVPILLIAFWSCLSWGANHYIDPDCGTDGEGTTTTCASTPGGAGPWNNIISVNGTVSGHTYVPGDQILFKGGSTLIMSDGSYPWLTSTNVPGSGNKDNPIIVDSYGTGRATLSISNADRCFRLSALSGIHIQNLIINGSMSATEFGGAIIAYNWTTPRRSNLHITNCDLSGHYAGIALTGVSLGWDDVLIENCTIHDVTYYGIMSLTEGANKVNVNDAFTNVIIRNNQIYNVLGGKGALVEAHGVNLYNIKNLTLELNKIYDIGVNHSEMNFGVTVSTGDNALIQSNEVYNVKKKGSYDGGGINCDGGMTNSFVQYNYTHDNDGPGFAASEDDAHALAWSNNTYRYNISVNDGRNGHVGARFYIWNERGDPDYLFNGYVYNNTFMCTNAGAGTLSLVYILIPAGSFTFRNNIFVINNKPLLIMGSGSTITMDYNDWYENGGTFAMQWNGSDYSTWADWKTASSQEANGKNVDPLFVSATDVRLQSGSPVKDAGVNICTAAGVPFAGCTGAGTGTYIDYAGMSVPFGSAPDIGAYEYHIPVTDKGTFRGMFKGMTVPGPGRH